MISERGNSSDNGGFDSDMVIVVVVVVIVVTIATEFGSVVMNSSDR